MSLLVFYPHKNYGAPSLVARNLVENLITKKDEINTDLKIFCAKKPDNDTEGVFISFSDLKILNHIGLLHIPTSPQISINSKLILYIIALGKNSKILHNLHNDTYLEIVHKFNLSLTPHYYLYPKFLRKISVLITNSYMMSDYLIPRYSLQNIAVIPNCIEDWWFEKSEENIEILGDPAIFHHNRLWADKGLYQLLIAFASVINKNKKAVLTVAGTGPLRNYYASVIKKLGLKDNVILLGHKNRMEIKKYLESSDFAIYPSLNEPFSMATLEAFSSCKGPVFYSIVAGIEDFVKLDGFNFHSFYPSTYNLKIILQNIIEGNYDNQNSKKQREFAKKYNINYVTKKYIDLYNVELMNYVH